jgi:AraC-like DNA-binding protein
VTIMHAAPLPSAPSAERNVALTGAQAQDWLRTRGWVGDPARALRVFGDVFDAAEWTASRLWLGAGGHERAVPRGERRVCALLVAEGEATLELEGHSGDIAPGSIFVLGADSVARITSTRGIALYEVISDGQRIGLPLLGLDGTAGPFTASEDVWMSLSSVLNQVLGSALAPSAPSVRAVGRSVDNLVLAALQSSDLPGGGASAAEWTLLAQAKSLIASHSSTPGFSVTQLAELSNISRAHLYRLFATEGTTPRDHIRAVRVENARAQLEHLDPNDDLAVARVARSAGFRSVAAMRDALVRDEPTP